MSRIAVVEDEEDVAEALAFSLRRAGHTVDLIGDGLDALEALIPEPPDLLVLDLMLPGLDGLDICLRLRRRHPALPILILSARGEECDRVRGLEAGADDYVVKPFSLREVEMRISALLRRSNLPPPQGGLLLAGPFCIDEQAGTFTISDRPVHLSPKELALMRLFLQRPGKVIPREELLQEVWGEDFVGESKTLDVHVRWLREKLEQDPSRPQHLKTVRGRGFRLDL